MAYSEQIDKIINIQFKYSELANGIRIIKNDLKELNESVKAAEKDFKDSEAQVERLRSRLDTLKVGSRAYIKTQDELREATQRLANANDALVQAKTEQIAQSKALQQVERQYRSELQNNIKQELAAEGSLNKMRAQLSKLRAEYQNVSADGRKKLAPQINELKNKVKEADYEIQEFYSNVGNYSSAFNPLNTQVQMLVREVPSLTMSFNQFFMAISNNLPMFADELQRAKKANDDLRAGGKPTVSVIKQVIKSIFSWQTLLVVGITLLASYGDEIMNFISGLVKGKKAVDVMAEAQKEYNSTMNQGRIDAQEEITRLELLNEAVTDVSSSMEERKRALKTLRNEYSGYLQDMTDEEVLMGRLTGKMGDMKNKLIELAQARAAERKIMELEEKKIQLEIVEGYDKLTNAAEAYKKAGEKKVDVYGSWATDLAYFLDAQETFFDAQDTVIKNLKKTGEGGKELAKVIKNAYGGDALKAIEAFDASIDKLQAKAIKGYTMEDPTATGGGSGAPTRVANTLDNGAKARDRMIEDTKSRLVSLSEDIYRRTLDLLDKTKEGDLERIRQTEEHELASIDKRLAANKAAQEANKRNGEIIDEELSTYLVEEQEELEKNKTLITEQYARERAETEARWSKQALDEQIAERERELSKARLDDQMRETQFKLQNPKDEEGFLAEQGITAANELARAQEELSRITQSNYTEMGVSAEEYAQTVQRATAGVLAAQMNVQKNTEAQISLEQYKTQMTLSGTTQLIGGLSQVAEAAGASAGVTKALAIAQAAAGMAAAIYMASILPFPFNLTSIATVLAQFASIIATIRSLNSESDAQKYAQGGLIAVSDNAGIIQGPSHARGGVPISLGGKKVGEVEGGELLAIVNKRDTEQLDLLSRLNARHGRRFADGGLIDWSGVYHSMGVQPGHAIQADNLSTGFDMKSMAAALRQALIGMPAPVVAVRDVNSAQRRVKISDNLYNQGRITR